MRKRFLAGLLAAGMVLQSFALPVTAAGGERGHAEISETDPDDADDAFFQEESQKGETGSVSEEASADPMTFPDGECESSLPVPSEEGENEDTETSEEESETPVIPEEETEELQTPATEEIPVVPDLKEEETSSQIPEDREENSEPVISHVDGGEGIYQEGSFTVGGEEAGDEYGISLYVETDFSGAETYLYEQFLKKEETIDVSGYGIPRNMVGALVHGVINEHPDLYFVNGAFSYSMDAQGLVLDLYMTYAEGFDDAAFDQAVKEALSVVKEGMTDLEKAIALHEYIVLNCAYDYENYLNSTMSPNVYSAYGVMVDRAAVCQGYALAYKMLLNRSGIECYMVTSDAMNHAWNLVKLDGQYYQVDTTWDDPVWDRLGLVQHGYMFVSDEAFGTESAVRSRHYGWVITKGSETVDLTAEDSKYDNAFWTVYNSPLSLLDHNYYYIDSSTKSICMRSSIDAPPSVLVANIGTWTTPNGSYWQGAFSGLSMVGDRLYYNTPYNICSVSLKGGEVRDETQELNSSGRFVYSSAFCQGKLQYVLHESPDDRGKEKVFTVQAGQMGLVSIEPDDLFMESGETASLYASISPSFEEDTDKEIIWTTDNENVATVSGGTVTAVGDGRCTITAESGGKTDTCQITVGKRLAEPVFSLEPGRVDKGESVTLSAAEGALIYYTTNGGNPKVPDYTNATKQYAGPIVINEDIMIRAIAVDPNAAFGNSNIVTAEYQACTNDLILEKESLTIALGETVTLGITELPTTKTETDVTWGSSDEAVVTAEAGGKLTAVSEGNAVVTATTTDHKGRTVTDSCEVKVEDAEYLVTFIGWNNEVIKTETVKSGKAATPPEITTIPEGYEFKGWKGDYGNISQDTAIEALFEPIAYTITYELGGGTNAAGNPAGYTIETEDITLKPAGGKEGYLFAGWYRDENYQNKIETIKKGSKGNLILYARWKDERGLWLKAEGSDRENFIPDEAYTGKAIKPVVEVYYGSTPLKAGTDYTISYKNNTAANLLRTDGEKEKAPTVVIKGKGNFAGTLTCSFVITPKSIAPVNGAGLKGEEVQADDLAAAYQNGRAVKPVPVLIWNGKKLSNKKDFTVEYPDESTNTDAYKIPGNYKVRITGKGNFTGTREITLTIADPSQDVLMSKVKISKIPEQPYTGGPVVFGKDTPRLTYAGEELEPDVDYNLSFAPGDDGVSAGSHVLVIHGLGKYKGVRRVNFKIKGIPISTVTVNGLKPLVYNGMEQSFGEGSANQLTLTDKEGNTLAQGRDYTLSFSNHKNAGTAKVTITGTGKYSGKLTKTFKITACSIAGENPEIEAVFENNSTEQLYEKGGARPKVAVTFRGVLLEEGTDYTVSYSNHTSVVPKEGKTPTVTIKGKKNFTGNRQLSFTVKAKSLDDTGISITAPDLEENTKAGKFMSVPVLTDANGKKLKAGTDYEKTYVYTDQNGNELGKGDTPPKDSLLTVTVTGKGNYKGSADVTFRILAKGMNISKASARVETQVYYTGEEIGLTEKDLTVKLGTTILTANDFEIIGYSNNIKKGTAKVTIRGKGKYGGTKQISFKILPQSMKWWNRG